MEARRSSKFAEVPHSETTVVLTGLPKTLNAEIMLGILDKSFAGRYDYFYLPMDVERVESRGLAYINFRSHADAVRCCRDFNGFSRWPGTQHDRRCRGQWSSIQGLEANIEKQQQADWVSCNVPEDCKPMVFDEEGIRLPTWEVFVSLDNKASGSSSNDKGWTNEWYGSSSSQPSDRNTHEGWSEWSKTEWNYGWSKEDSWKDKTWKSAWSKEKSAWSRDETWTSAWSKEKSAWSRDETWTSAWSKEKSAWSKKDRWDTGMRGFQEVSQLEQCEVTKVPQVSPSEQVSLVELFEGLRLVDPLRLDSVDATRAAPAVWSESESSCVACGAKYACPACRAGFAKWSACQHHIVNSECVKVIELDKVDLQEVCKQAIHRTEKEVDRGQAIQTHQESIVEEERRFQ
ncbi:unnamed protein product [Durusdinium trenchii]|uniref:Mei2-like C-terminal RNA recognition motif domain-containing protein n=1 Tax=Durusdinium trenchii TaxID=1381693 RepID=A0ABP0K278_9DINO